LNCPFERTKLNDGIKIFSGSTIFTCVGIPYNFVLNKNCKTQAKLFSLILIDEVKAATDMAEIKECLTELGKDAMVAPQVVILKE